MKTGFLKGVVLGGYLQGVEVKDKAFAGGALDWLAPFPLFTGLALLGGYALLGATWLVMKIEGPLADRKIVAYEIPEFPAWARDQGILEAAVSIRFASAALIVGAGYNHFELLETLASPYGFFGRAVLEQMKLKPA